MGGIDIAILCKAEYVLYFGRYSEEKGVRTLCTACRELPDIQFVFAGKGHLKELVDGIDNVDDIGFQLNNDLDSWVRNARFVVVPSEWYEPFGLTVIEAISLGTPVVGANIAGIQEIIEGNPVGIVYEAGNKEEMKETILKLWNDDIAYRKLKQGCNLYHFMTVEKYYSRLFNGIYCGEDRDENTDY